MLLNYHHSQQKYCRFRGNTVTVSLLSLERCVTQRPHARQRTRQNSDLAVYRQHTLTEISIVRLAELSTTTETEVKVFTAVHRPPFYGAQTHKLVVEKSTTK